MLLNVYCSLESNTCNTQCSTMLIGCSLSINDCCFLFRGAVSRYWSPIIYNGLGTWHTTPVPYNNRLCNICQVLDDEFHLLFKCQLVQDLRVKYIKRYYYTRPSMKKLLQLLSNENKPTYGTFRYSSRKGWILNKMQIPRTHVITNVL